MAKKTREEMVEWTVAKCDEVLPNSAQSTSELIMEAPVGFIEDELDRSADFILQVAPSEMLSPLTKQGTEHSPGGAAIRLDVDSDLKGIVVLPSDFKRFMSLKLDNWKQPIFELMDRKDPKYRLQTGLRKGTYHKPVGVLIPFSKYEVAEIGAWDNVGLAVELFSAKTESDTLEGFEYIPKTTAEDIPEEVQDAVAWICASRTLQILKKHDEAALAEQRAMRQLEFKIGTFSDKNK